MLLNSLMLLAQDYTAVVLIGRSAYWYCFTYLATGHDAVIVPIVGARQILKPARYLNTAMRLHMGSTIEV